MSEVRTVLAEVLRQHSYCPVTRARVGKCLGPQCDWRGTEAEHAGHLADVVCALPRVAVVALPEPEFDDDGQAWFDDYDIRVDLTGREHGVYVLRSPCSVSRLRSSAAAQLAAAALMDLEQPVGTR